MKKEYIKPAIKAKAINTEQLMNSASDTLEINTTDQIYETSQDVKLNAKEINFNLWDDEDDE